MYTQVPNLHMPTLTLARPYITGPGAGSWNHWPAGINAPASWELDIHNRGSWNQATRNWELDN